MLFWKSGGSQAEVRFLTAEGNTVSTRPLAPAARQKCLESTKRNGIILKQLGNSQQLRPASSLRLGASSRHGSASLHVIVANMTLKLKGVGGGAGRVRGFGCSLSLESAFGISFLQNI